jgi:signal transduction histidine kinase/CheY-like chemotaxis protein
MKALPLRRADGTVVRWLALVGSALVVVVAAVAAWRPTGFRFDVAVLGIAASIGVVPGILATLAGGAVTAFLHHDDWRAAVPFAIAVLCGPGIAVAVRRPVRNTDLPSRTAARLLWLLLGAAVAGWLEHALRSDGLHAHEVHIALGGLRILCGALIAAAFIWRPRRSGDTNTVLLSALAMALSTVLILVTLGFWGRQDEQLLHVTVDASQQGFLFTLADQMNVITNKAETSPVEPFTAQRFPVLMQPVVFGHIAIPAAQLVELDSDGATVVARLSSLGGDFEAQFDEWTTQAVPELRNAAASGVLAYLGLAALPQPTGGSSPYLVYGSLLQPAPNQAAEPMRLLVAAVSVPVMIRSASAATMVNTGEARLEVFTQFEGVYVRLWSTDSERSGADSALGGAFEPAEPPVDRVGSVALASFGVNDSEFIFAAEPGIDFGTPLGFRRLVVALEAIAGLVLMGIILVNGDHRMNRERERMRREALLAAALEGSPGWTSIVDMNDRVEMSNSNPLGVGAGSHLSEVALWQDDPDAVGSLLKVVRTARDGVPSGMQYIWSRPDDPGQGMRIFEIEARPLPDPTLVYVQCVDVTEHRDRAMRTAQSERMEAIGVLAGGLAHDFNNLLFITLGYLQMLERQKLIADDRQSHLYVARAIEAVERGAVVAKSLLSFARSQPLAAVPVNMSQFLHDLQPLIEQALGSAHQLTLQAVGEHLDVMVDPGRLSSSVLNAVFNSRDAMDGRGTVEIRAERCVAAPIGGEARSVIGLSIRDTGRGMSPDVLARVFEPFFTTKQVGSGTGLGLSTLYSFAQQSGGWAAIDSIEGVGTTVTLFLPPALGPSTEDAPVRLTRRATRALVVDDEAALADLVAGWLDDLGMETRVATTPEAAISTAEAFEPELLISDANLGASIDGLELARILVERDPALLVVFMTGFSERIRALQAAGVATLAKPFSRDDLVASLGAMELGA